MVEKQIPITESCLTADFKNGVMYIAHTSVDGIKPTVCLKDIVSNGRYFIVGERESFMSNYSAVNEMETGNAAKIMLEGVGFPVHHHSGVIVEMAGQTRMDTDALLIHSGANDGCFVPDLEKVSTDEDALLVFKGTLFAFEIKSAFSGRNDDFANKRYDDVIKQLHKHSRVWQDMKKNPKDFKMTTRFGSVLEVNHFINSRYFLYGVSSPLFNPYLLEKFLSNQPKILPMCLSGTRFTPVFSKDQSLESVTMGTLASPLVLFKRLQPFLRIL